MQDKIRTFFQKTVWVNVLTPVNIVRKILWIIDSWQLKQIIKLYIYFLTFNTISSVKLFVVTVQIFVYKLLFTIVFFGKKNKNSWKTSHNFSKVTTFWKWKHLSKKNHVLKMKTPLEKEPHFENGSSFRNVFWNENMFSGKHLQCCSSNANVFPFIKAVFLWKVWLFLLVPWSLPLFQMWKFHVLTTA